MKINSPRPWHGVLYRADDFADGSVIFGTDSVIGADSVGVDDAAVDSIVTGRGTSTPVVAEVVPFSP